MKSREEIQQEALEAIESNDYNGFLFAATGFGKTKVALDALQSYHNKINQGKYLWVVPTTRLRDVGVPKEIDKWASNLKYSIDLVCYASLHKVLVSKYDIIIADECHHITEKVLESLCHKKKLIGISATPPEEKDRRDLLFTLGKEIFSYSLDEAVEAGIVDDYEIIIIKMELDSSSKNIPIKYNKNSDKQQKGFKTTEKANYEYLDSMMRKAFASKNDARIKSAMFKRQDALYTYKSKILAAQQLIKKLYSPSDRVLIFTARTNVADRLHEHRYHSKDKTGIDEFTSHRTNKLSTCKALDEGENLGKLDSIFIHQINSKVRIITQRIGRSIRLSDKEHSKVYILCYANTQDEKWVHKAVRKFKNVRVVYLHDVLNNYVSI